MSRQRKRDAVLRLLRGEDLETVSRSLGVTAAALTGWRDAFLAAGEASLTSRPADGAASESGRLKARLGEMLLERELLEAKIAALEANRPLHLLIANQLCFEVPLMSVAAIRPPHTTGRRRGQIAQRGGASHRICRGAQKGVHKTVGGDAVPL